MTDLTSYYPIHSIEVIRQYLGSYLPLVSHVADQLGLNLNASTIKGDHLGLQVLSSDEFNKCHTVLLGISDMIHDGIIHNRRNRIYRLKTIPAVNTIQVPKIEIFEPKPGADLSKLRPGIEHIAFLVDDYDTFLDTCKQHSVPIDREVDLNGSKFFKTKLINGIEIEFRNNKHGEWN